jgi:signal transduction histidine kinase
VRQHRVAVIIGRFALEPQGNISATQAAPSAAASARVAESNARLVELSKLAGGLAHEIRNPLSAVTLNLQLLDEDLGKPEVNGDIVRRSRKRIQSVREEVRRLSDVLDDFLRFARMPRPELIPTDLNRVVADVLRFLSPEIRRNKVTLRVSYGDLPQSLMDANLIKQALLNVFLNAQQAMPDGGEIMVRTAINGDELHVTVADTGAGVPPEVQARLFEPYFSTKPKGSGLGLSQVKRIVEEHGGRVEFFSEPQKGSCFTLAFPVRDVAPEAVP